MRSLNIRLQSLLIYRILHSFFVLKASRWLDIIDWGFSHQDTAAHLFFSARILYIIMAKKARRFQNINPTRLSFEIPLLIQA